MEPVNRDVLPGQGTAVDAGKTTGSVQDTLPESVQVARKTLEAGKLYRFNGTDLEELEPSEEQKLPIRADALEAVKAVRKAAQKSLGSRPELSVVASAMLRAAAELPDMVERVEVYGFEAYRQALERRKAGRS